MIQLLNNKETEDLIKINIYDKPGFSNSYRIPKKSIVPYIEYINSTVIKTDIGDILIKEIQQNTITNEIIHISAMKVDENSYVKINIPINCTNWNSKKEHKKLILINNCSILKCSLYVKDIVNRIDIDTSLYTSEKKIYISDIKNYYPKLKFFNDDKFCILKISQLKLK